MAGGAGSIIQAVDGRGLSSVDCLASDALQRNRPQFDRLLAASIAMDFSAHHWTNAHCVSENNPSE